MVYNGGWAVLEIGDMEKAVTLDISFFHDSLKELAQSAISLRPKDELGEHRLIPKKRARTFSMN